VVGAAEGVREVDSMRILPNHVAPHRLGILPYVATTPRLVEREGKQEQENSPDQRPEPGWPRPRARRIVEPPCEGEKQADVRKVGVTIRHHGLPDGGELEHEEDVHQEETEAERDDPRATAGNHG